MPWIPTSNCSPSTPGTGNIRPFNKSNAAFRRQAEFRYGWQSPCFFLLLINIPELPHLKLRLNHGNHQLHISVVIGLLEPTCGHIEIALKDASHVSHQTATVQGCNAAVLDADRSESVSSISTGGCSCAKHLAPPPIATYATLRFCVLCCILSRLGGFTDQHGCGVVS